MADEKTNEVVEQPDANAVEQADANTSDAPAPKKKSKKWTIIGVIVGVIVVCGIGMWIWHSDPSFCNNPVCHTSMDPYVATYNSPENGTATDKWGNEVANSNAMLVVSHKEQGKKCLDCHVPDLSQQLAEVGETLSGNYYVPLSEVSVLELRENAHQGSESGRGDEFCMNQTCHSDLSRQELTQRTSGLSFNPHAWQHEQNECSACHKSHRASTLMCTECHAEAKSIMPEGWVDAGTAKSYAAAIG